MNTVLVVVKLATSDYGLSQAVYQAHRLSGDAPYLVDFPGLDNAQWGVRHHHAVGRLALIYGDHAFCLAVQAALGPIRLSAQDNARFVALKIPASELKGRIWDERSTVQVRRQPLRKSSPEAALKSAQRLQAKFLREGRALTHPIIPHERCTVDAQGRWAGLRYDPVTGKTSPIKNVLVLPSSTGHHFANTLTRNVSDGAPFFGDRDSYGFAKGAQGGSVPRVDEAALFSELIGEEMEPEGRRHA